MTNNEIIFWESYELMKQGKIKGTGRIIEMETENGRVQVEEPEALHTFAAWKQLGYVSRKASTLPPRSPSGSTLPSSCPPIPETPKPIK